jgi:cellulose synthase/poly-beta-1,6-N-acetylglucosamine synthase-like glycosyltransferase/spore germination protein YaaH/peptidoglycan/xylan/chitin deacetylase (PgdA/CDA1 family)
LKSKPKPVFYTESPKRWKTFVGLFRVFGIVFALLLIVIAFTFSRQSGTALPKLGGQTEIYKRVLNPEHITTFQTSQNKFYKNSRHKLSYKLDLSYSGKYHSTAKTIPRIPKQIRCAFYVNWDPQSFTSLHENIAKLNMVMPEWMFVVKGKDTVVADIDARALKLMRDHEIPILPMLSNFYNGKWNGDAVHDIISSEEKRKTFIASVLKCLKQNSFSGINVDLESLSEEGDENLWHFQKELYEVLHKEGLQVTQDIPPFNTDYNLANLELYNDYIVLMAYDMHYVSSTPGPVAPIDWVEASIHDLNKKIPAGKIIVGIPTYGYDWPDGDEGTDVTYQEAVVTAKESEGKILFDENNFNLNYNYSDENDHHHQVWFSDAATCFNTMRLASDYNTAGVALWRLGGEDKRLWNFYSKDLSNGKLITDTVDYYKLDKILPTYDVDFEGEGDILEVVSTPDSGLIDVQYDKKEQIITAEKYLELPSNYVMKKFGKDEKKIVLSFDDGPDEKYTPQILDILKEYKIPAAFFVIGLNAEKNLDILKRMYDEGHEIGNHSFSHPKLAEINSERASLELTVTRKIIESLTGHTTLLFRPPYNADAEPETYDEVYPIVLASKQNYITVCESIDPTDWKKDVTVDSIMARIIHEQSYGNIILLHDAGGNREATIEALPKIIKYFRDKGYKFVSVAELLGKKRDDVMPALSNQNDIYYSKLNWVIAEIIFWGEKFLFTLFLVAIILSVGRTVLVAILSMIQKRKNKIEKQNLNGNPLLSIIVPTYNEEVNVIRTIERLLESDYKNFEIIIVNDGSTDGTLAVVSKRFDGNARVKIVTKQNGGKASALNYGIGISTSEFLVCIDADTQLKNNAVSELMKYFDEENVAAVAGNVKVGNEINMLTKWQSVEYITSQNFDRRAFDLINAITVVPGAIGAFRKDALIKIGKFSTDTLAEDCDLTIRLLMEGYKVKYSHNAIAYTEAPETIKMFLKQRFRWTFGIMQSVWKNRGTIFNHKYGGLGMAAMPNAVIFQFMLPLLSPLVDFMMAVSIFTGQWFQTLVYYLAFTMVDLMGSLLAFSYEKEKTRKLWTLIPQRIIYRQLMFWVLLKSIISALRGTLIGWGVLKRTGTVKLAN